MNISKLSQDELNEFMRKRLREEKVGPPLADRFGSELPEQIFVQLKDSPERNRIIEAAIYNLKQENKSQTHLINLSSMLFLMQATEALDAIKEEILANEQKLHDSSKEDYARLLATYASLQSDPEMVDFLGTFVG